jgi:cytochrome c oxidase assembly factor CtaG
MHAGVSALLDVVASRSTAGWKFEPGIVLPLTITAVAYWRGTVVLRRRAPRASHVWRDASFAAGWLVLCLALMSPLHDVSEQLFSAHMIQHELLMVVAAPLLAIGRPFTTLAWSLPHRTRLRLMTALAAPWPRRAWRLAARPFHAWLGHAVAIWLWHVPALFEATLRSDAVHAAQHLCFVGSAFVFWWSLMYGQRRAARGLSILYLFTTAVHTGVLGALIAFSRTPWYPSYAAASRTAWGLTPLADQQLAGLIMWIPASLAYLAAALVIVARWLRESEWSVARDERLVAVTPGHSP